MKKCDRRIFLRQTTLFSSAMMAGIGWCQDFAGENRHLSAPAQKLSTSRVVFAHRSDVRTSAGLVAGEMVCKLLDAAVENLFQLKARQAWRKLFGPDDIVGLKVNCLAGKGLSTRPELVEAVVERLKEAGLAAHRIIIWDRHDNDLIRAGYKIYRGRQNTQCYGNNSVGYTRQVFEHGSVGSLLSQIIRNQCTAVINLPILKDHGIVGVSVGLKNYFGAIDNPNKYHDNIGDPYVADVNMLADIRHKTRLTICDALTAQYEGGPPYMPHWTWEMDSLIAATDMVALDYLGWQIIEQKRAENGFASLEEVGRKPTYIATAADRDHLLGTDDPDRIEVIKC